MRSWFSTPLPKAERHSLVLFSSLHPSLVWNPDLLSGILWVFFWAFRVATSCVKMKVRFYSSGPHGGRTGSGVVERFAAILLRVTVPTTQKPSLHPLCGEPCQRKPNLYGLHYNPQSSPSLVSLSWGVKSSKRDLPSVLYGSLKIDKVSRKWMDSLAFHNIPFKENNPESRNLDRFFFIFCFRFICCPLLLLFLTCFYLGGIWCDYNFKSFINVLTNPKEAAGHWSGLRQDAVGQAAGPTALSRWLMMDEGKVYFSSAVGEVKCKERCTRSLWAIHLPGDKLSEAAVPWGEERERARVREWRNWIHYAKCNLTRKCPTFYYRHPAPKMEAREGRILPHICQTLKQAWRGVVQTSLTLIPSKFLRGPGKAQGISSGSDQ